MTLDEAMRLIAAELERRHDLHIRSLGRDPEKYTSEYSLALDKLRSAMRPVTMNPVMAMPYGQSVQSTDATITPADDIVAVLGRIAALAENSTDFIEEKRVMPASGVGDDLYKAVDTIVDLRAQLEEAKYLLIDAQVQLREGKIKTRRNRADLIDQFFTKHNPER